MLLSLITMNILLCLCEPQLLTVTSELLRRNGIQVMGTNSSTEAMEIVLTRLPFDAVIFDLNSVPQSAKEIVPQLRAINQTLPVLLTTGGLSPPDVFFDQFRVEWLPKPLSVGVLIPSIERAIMLSGRMPLVYFWEALALAEKVFDSLPKNNQDEAQEASFGEIFGDRREFVIGELATQTGVDRAHLLSNFELGMILDKNCARAVADLIFWLKTYGK